MNNCPNCRIGKMVAGFISAPECDIQCKPTKEQVLDYAAAIVQQAAAEALTIQTYVEQLQARYPNAEIRRDGDRLIVRPPAYAENIEVDLEFSL